MTDARTGADRPWGEVVAFALLVAVGIVFVTSSFGYGVLQEGGRIGPGFLPLVLGALLVLLSLIQLAGRLRPLGAPAEHHHQTGEAPVLGAQVLLEHQDEEHPEPDVDILGRSARYRARQLWMVLGGVAVTVVVVPYLGFLVAFGALILFISVVVERRRVLPSILVALAAIGIVFGVFVEFLNVPLPTGPLNF